ncbi:hypothetical protein QVD17_05873 [Tagetes erecta]|uniref:Uncharacterized protein n=1 Tax=Tagetes erecta TaxID=13708 RepID=A0AAD8LIC9_TARER|nr:hypothetical protein QVD17_05873 [Tagetes erecta]
MEGDDERRSGNKRGRDNDDEQKQQEGRLEKKPSGIHMINVIEEYSYSGDEMINGVKYEEEKQDTPTSKNPSPSAGLFNQLITNLVNTTNTSNNPDCENSNSNSNNGINNDIINSNGNSNSIKVAENEKDGSIIDDIVDKLPRTLSEDTVVPAADEASILIHSIIHD